MKKRVFYVINLDRSRIWILATLLVSTLLFAFATGFRVGAAKSSDLQTENSLTSNILSAGELDELDLSMQTTETADSPHGVEDPALANRATDPDMGDSGIPPARESPSFERLRDYPSGSGKYALSNPPAKSSASEKTSAPEKKSKEANARQSAEKKSASGSSSKKIASALKDKSSNKKEQKSNSNAKSTASKAERSGAANPRSALLDASSGELRMSNISKERPPAVAPRNETDTQPANRKTYSLQIAAFRSEAAAKRMAGTLEKQGFHPYIVKSKKTYTVRVGKSDNAKGLWKLETGLRAKNYAPMRVSH